MSRAATIIIIALTATASCKSKDAAKQEPKVVEHGSAAAKEVDDRPGATTADAAAQGLFDALAKKDKALVKRFIPNDAACKALPAFKQCPDIVAGFDKNWDSVQTIAAPYAHAQLTKSKDAPPMPGSEGFIATVAGKAPMLVMGFKSGDRYFAVFQVQDAKAPSTGKEMPSELTMKPEQAKVLVADALKSAAAPKHDCKAITNTLSTALPVAYPEISAESAPAYNVLQRCALETQHWRAAIHAGVMLLRSNPEVFNIVQIVRALAEMGEYDEALAAAKELFPKFPAAQEALMEAQVFTYCRAESWDQCQQAAEKALAEFAKRKDGPTSEGMILGRFFRDYAWVVTGKPKEAVQDIEALEKVLGKELPLLAPVKRDGAIAIERGFYLEYLVVPQLATGVYHLMGKATTGALVTLKLHEHTNAARKFRVEAEVPGVTEKSSNSLVLGPKESTIKFVNPPLKMDFDVSKVRGPRPAQLVLKIVEETKAGDRSIVDETIAIEVLPRDYLPLKRKVGSDSSIPTFGFLGAWITSNDKAVDEFLGKAKKRMPNGAFVGEQAATTAQVKALFDELKARGMSYVMDPEVTATTAVVQRTRLPGEVLSSTNAQCLEGTLTFATLMEAIGLKPIVVIVPGHAFVGWHTVAQDGTHGEPLFVETTMVGNAEFDQAVTVATRRVAQEMKAGSFKTGDATFVDIADVHAKGFTAQPM